MGINPVEHSSDDYWLAKALSLAEQAQEQGEVPVGAVLIHDNTLIGAGHNATMTTSDPTAHAEIIAMRQAGTHLANYRLPDTTLYVTLEPCCMCAGAMVHARIKRLVFGTYDPRSGAIVSQMQLLDSPFLNHRIQWTGGCSESICAAILQKFFQVRRR